MSMKNIYKSKVQATFLGVAIGDAMGMPVETMSAEEIGKLNNGQGVTTFMDAVQTRFDDLKYYVAGQTTDDWQLTSAIARSLIRCGGYDLKDILFEHIREAKKSTAGWGKSTRNSVFNIEKFYLTKGKEGRDPTVFQKQIIENIGSGNGVAMKIAPLAMFKVLQNEKVSNEQMLDICLEIGRATHDNVRASITAYSLCWLMSSLVNEQLSVDVQKIEYRIRELIKAIIVVEKRFCLESNLVSDQIKLIFSNQGIKNISSLIVELGTSCQAIESVPFAIAVFCRNPINFRAGVLEAVNAGGDTDTIASMVGALIGANNGLDSIPKEWQEFNQTFVQARQLGLKFFDIFS